uniref:Uncharacterized protein n=1 Tax=Knipowitschia caucasica TaxID=637954 RepID=A0AAV2M3I7_KNICA
MATRDALKTKDEEEEEEFHEAAETLLQHDCTDTNYEIPKPKVAVLCVGPDVVSFAVEPHPSPQTFDLVIEYSAAEQRGTVVHRDSPSVDITGLCPGTDYTFTITRRTQSSQTCVRVVTAPIPPPLLSISDIRADSVTLSWEPPAGKVQNYSVTCSSGEDVIQEFQTEETSVTIRDLRPGQQYLFSVCAQLQNRLQSEAAETSTHTKTYVESVLKDLDLEIYYKKKLCLNKVLQIDEKTMTENNVMSNKDVAWYFLKELMMSEILNKLLSNSQQNHDTFVHRNMQCGDNPRIISNGLAELTWEMGQLYEASLSLPEEDPSRQQLQHLPKLCAQLLIDGFPLELVDGDASNIPLRWVSDVLTQLHELVSPNNKILVVTVLGVQSTGKSTLLNTMFGVQFAVSSGRCTRGAFMLLIRVSEDMKASLNCDFLVIIDTEGLKSPELAQLDDSHEHDNELATLVVGLSDITIINIAMENSTDMKDILQIVVHAFLRMKEVGKKPRCQFVHQNVSDVSAHDKNLRDRELLLQQLNDMTEAAAKMERKEENKSFTDVMDYDPDTGNCSAHGQLSSTMCYST